MDENRGAIILGNLHINQEFIKLNEFHGAGSASDAVLLVGAEGAYTYARPDPRSQCLVLDVCPEMSDDDDPG